MLYLKEDSKVLASNDAIGVLNKANASRKSAVIFDNKEQVIVFIYDKGGEFLNFLGNYKSWYRYIKKNYKYGRFNTYVSDDKELVGNSDIVDKLKNHTKQHILEMIIDSEVLR